MTANMGGLLIVIRHVCFCSDPSASVHTGICLWHDLPKRSKVAWCRQKSRYTVYFELCFVLSVHVHVHVHVLVLVHDYVCLFI